MPIGTLGGDESTGQTGFSSVDGTSSGADFKNTSGALSVGLFF